MQGQFGGLRSGTASRRASHGASRDRKKFIGGTKRSETEKRRKGSPSNLTFRISSTASGRIAAALPRRGRNRRKQPNKQKKNYHKTNDSSCLANKANTKPNSRQPQKSIDSTISYCKTPNTRLTTRVLAGGRRAREEEAVRDLLSSVFAGGLVRHLSSVCP